MANLLGAKYDNLRSQLQLAKGAIQSLAGCFPDKIYVFGPSGERWSDYEPPDSEYETVDLQELLKKLEI